MPEMPRAHVYEPIPLDKLVPQTVEMQTLNALVRIEALLTQAVALLSPPAVEQVNSTEEIPTAKVKSTKRKS